MIFFGLLNINPVGLAYGLISIGVGFLTGFGLHAAGIGLFVVLLCGLNAGVLVAGLLAASYDRHVKFGYFESYNTYLKVLLIGQGHHPGRIAMFGCPLAWFPALLLLLFLIMWLGGILLELKTVQAVQFIAVSVATIVICAVTQVFATMQEKSGSTF